MKSRLVKRDDIYQLLLSNGIIKTVSEEEAANYIKYYKESEFFLDEDGWDYDISMEDFDGNTIAQVSDEGILQIFDYNFYKNIVNKKAVKFISVNDYAALHGKKGAVIRKWCKEQRIPGAIYEKHAWKIPEDAPYPKDSRKGKRVATEE